MRENHFRTWRICSAASTTLTVDRRVRGRPPGMLGTYIVPIIYYSLYGCIVYGVTSYPPDVSDHKSAWAKGFNESDGTYSLYPEIMRVSRP